MSKKKHLILIGAGPGDPELITLKAVRWLQKADVVLYDALSNKDLLQHCSSKAITKNVGKRGNSNSYTQPQIEKYILEYGNQFDCIVRLKGGDPFVFGRGQEEIDFAKAHGFTTEVVPGISSALALPSLAGVPVTHRDVNSSFWVLTGADKTGSYAADLKLAAASKATLIILMGVKKMPEIIEIIMETRGENLPVLVIENGTLAHERRILGKAKDIVTKCQDKNITSPAVIIAGDVVNFGVEYKK